MKRVIMVAVVMALLMVAVAGPALAILPKRGFVIHDVVVEDGSSLAFGNTYVDHPSGLAFDAQHNNHIHVTYE